METQQKQRIDWIDIYKGVLIACVVIGHATGDFRQYIYQFHMAAFFLIHGYTTSIRDKSFASVVIEKFYKLQLPYYFLGFVGTGLFALLNYWGGLHCVSSTEFPDSFIIAIKAMFQGSGLYCDWLGAIWFLPVLFYACVMAKLIMMISRNNKLVTFLLSTLVLFWGESLAGSGLQYYNFDLAGIAQWFVICGNLLKTVELPKTKKVFSVLGCVLTAVIWYVSVHYITNLIVDWPTRKLHGVWDMYLPVWGIVFVFFLSVLLSYSKYLKKAFIYIGKNTMGIMCLHFLGFKVAYLLFVVVGKIKLENMNNLTPHESINGFWPVIVVISIAFSIFAWNMLSKVPHFLACVGGESVKQLKQQLAEGYFGSKISEIYCGIIAMMKQERQEYKSYTKKVNRKWFDRVVFLGVVLVVLVMRYNTIHEDVNVTFPDVSAKVTYMDGWLPENPEEDYRWISNQSEFTVFLAKHSTIEIAGYIPDDIPDVSQVKIYVNGTEAYVAEATSGTALEISADLGAYIEQYADNVIRIEIDGVKIPPADAADQRRLSALINRMHIY